MSAATYDLIGRIINPGPGSQTPAQPSAMVVSNESVHVLIGRILAPPPASRSGVRP